MTLNLIDIVMYNDVLNDFNFESKEHNVFLGKHKENKDNFCVIKVYGPIFECFFLKKSDNQYILNNYKDAGWYFKSNKRRELIKSFIIGNIVLIKFYSHGNIAEEEYDKINYKTMKILDLEPTSLASLKFDNLRLSFDLHREDGPAYIEYDYNGNIFKEAYFQNGECFREEEDLPCYLKYDINGNVVEEIYYKNGAIHRDNDLPAKIVRFEDGQIQTASWFLNGKIDRKNGPAEIEKYDKLMCFSYYNNKILHCDTHAAIVILEKGDVIRKEYMLNGKDCEELEKAIIQSMEPDDEALAKLLLEEAKKAGM